MTTDHLPKSLLVPMRLRATIAVLGAVCTWASIVPGGGAVAQSARSGSVYSRFGVGELLSHSSPQAVAMGGAGLALKSFKYANVGNPASLSDQVFTRLTAGALFQTINQSDAANNQVTVATGYLDRVHFSFPVLSRRLGLGFAFAPFSRVGYQVRIREELPEVEGIQGAAPYRLSYEGRGGIHRLDAGLGLRIAPFLSVGASANFLWGVIEESQTVLFGDFAFNPSRTAFSTQMTGFTGTFAANFSARHVLAAEDELSIATTVMLPTDMKGDRIVAVGTSLDRDTLRAQTNVEANLPIGVGGGFAYELNSSFTMVLDYRYEPWSQFSSNVSFPGYALDSGGSFRDRHRVGGGVELLPAGRDLDIIGKFAERILHDLNACT